VQPPSEAGNPPAAPEGGGDPESAWGAVLSRYDSRVASLQWTALGAGGGFSGARVWRGEEGGKPALVLKAWPQGMKPERLAYIHSHAARARQLPFVPAVFLTTDQQSLVVAEGRVWDLCRWMPGTADYQTNPTPARLANACAALAQLHRAWQPATPVLAPSSMIRARLKLIAKWRDLAPAPVAIAGNDQLLEEAVRHGWEVARPAADETERLLRNWDDWPVFVQPCLRDVWGAHVLFTGDAVTGLIDYGSLKPDHVAIDLARLLGDLVEDDDAAFAAGLDAYRAAGGPLDLPADFVRMLDRTGVVVAVMNWLVRLCGGGYKHPDMASVAARLSRLAARVGRLFPG
jgi:hypothetical protein